MTSSHSVSFSSTEIDTLKSWTETERQNLCLTIWVDSVSLQIALCPINSSRKPIYQQPMPIQKASDLNQAFENLRLSFAQYHCTVIYSTMSFAGPVLQDHVVVTNWKCEARERVIHFTLLPFDLFPLDRRRFMNDLEAASYGIISRSTNGSLNSIFSTLWTNEGIDGSNSISLKGSSLVLFIGSGFGVSYISRIDSLEHNCVISSEAGHNHAVLCSPDNPKYNLEYHFVQFVSQKLHGGSHMPEWEDLCACRGLELAYQFIQSQQNQSFNSVISINQESTLNYSQIRNLAKSGNPSAKTAFELHYRFLMRAAQTMVFGIQCKRVFIIGQPQVENYPLVMELQSQLKETFEDHPKRDWINKITVYVQKETSTFPLSGGLFLSRLFAKSRQNQSH